MIKQIKIAKTKRSTICQSEKTLKMSKRPLERSCVDPEKRIEAAAHEVFRELGGAGYNEHVYQHSMRMELEMNGYVAECEVPVPIVYKGQHVGLGKVDLLVDGEIVVEVKAVQKLTPAMEAQGGGSIVNITTFSAFEPLLTFPTSSVYRVGFSSLAKLYSDRYGPANICMNCLLLGFTDSLDLPQKFA